MIDEFLLIQKMKQGDEEAIERFVRRYYEEILKYCSWRCFDAGYAEDLAQETFVRFFASLSDYRCRGKTKNYLYRIAGNLCKDFYRAKKELPVQDEELEKSGVPDTMDHILDKVMVEEAVGALSAEFQEVIVLFYFQEMKLLEIADVLKISLPLVKYRLRQARKQLEQNMRKE